ncbi:putative transcriptional regulator [Klebsiella pneumoniae]|nr:putative transcriptional regulator [Klebsiella pneumoniae]
MMNEPWQRLPALSLKQLQYFVTLAQLRHFTDTASRLAISQPALSSALRQIETVLGGKLVNRTAATVTLTELGAAILPHAQRILSVAQAAFSDMQQIVEAGGDGTVRIGLVPSVSSLLFPLLPQTLAEAFPRLRIEFHDQTNDALIQALLRGEIDFGIGAIDSSVPAELLVYPLREDPFVAVLHRDDPLAAQAHLPWKQLVGRDIAVFSKGNIQRLVAALVGESSPDADHALSGGLYRNPVWPGALALSGGHSAGAVHHPSAGPGAPGRPVAAAGADPYGGPDARPAGAAAAYRSLFFPAAGRIASR